MSPHSVLGSFLPRSLLLRLIYFISAAQLCIAAMWMVYSWQQVWGHELAQEQARLEAIARTIASDLDGALHEAESGGLPEPDALELWAGAPSSLVGMQRRLAEAAQRNEFPTPILTLELREDLRTVVEASPQAVLPGALDEILTSESDPAWRARHDYHPAMAPALLEGRTTSASYDHAGARWVSAFTPLRAGDEVTGLLVVRVPREVVAARARVGVRDEFLLIGGVVLLALAGVAVICVRVTRDLSELGRAARRFGAGEYREAISTASPIEEVRALAASMETAREQIQSDMQLREDLNHQMERARSEAELAARTKAQFLANMSHEIRTPLNGIIGMTGLLESSDLSSEQHEMMETVRKSGEHLLELIDDILDFSKLEAGKLELEEAEFDLRLLLEDTCEIVAPRAHEKGLELIVDLHPETPVQVAGDSARIRQVLLNFLTNAVKFTETGEVVVEVHARVPEGDRTHVLVSVRDSGIGIPPERRDALFRPFSQVDASTTRKYGGTGLGLAISSQLVRAMKGEIGVDSEPERGSTFWFQVPLAVRDAEPRAASRRTDELEGVRVLVADDSERMRAVLRSQLEAWGCEVHDRASADAALDFLASADGPACDLVLLDSGLSEASDAELAHRLRATGSGRSLPVVLLGRVVGGSSPERLEEAGFRGCLTKPVRQRQLAECLGAVLGVERLKRAGESPEERLVTEQTLLATCVRQRKRILLVEDNPVNQRVALALLQRAGYRCVLAANGAEALERLGEEPFDLVLMDCQMPVLDGYETTARIREREEAEGGHIPILAMTANALTGDRERCLAAGMDDYLSKPIDANKLYAAIESWLVAAEAESAEEAAELSDGAESLRSLLHDLGSALAEGRLGEADELAKALAGAAGDLHDEATRSLADGLVGASLSDAEREGDVTDWAERVSERARSL